MIFSCEFQHVFLSKNIKYLLEKSSITNFLVKSLEISSHDSGFLHRVCMIHSLPVHKQQLFNLTSHKFVCKFLLRRRLLKNRGFYFRDGSGGFRVNDPKRVNKIICLLDGLFFLENL